MRLHSPLLAALWLSLCPSVLAQDPSAQPPAPGVPAPDASGSLSLNTNQPSWTFDYSTQSASMANWIGLYYSAGGGPVDQKKGASNSIKWKWAPHAQGSVQIDSGSLEPGNYTAFFLANGGYTWLAQPLEVIKGREFGGDVSFIVSDVSLPNGRVDDKYSHSIKGLLRGGSSDVSFSKEGSNADWIKVSTDGIISGTPTSSSEEAVVTVRATGTDSASSAVFTINVAKSGNALLGQLKVLTLNMWNGGTRVSNYHDKQVKFLASCGADIVGIQEDQQGRHVPRLADALGWYHWSSGGDVGIKWPTSVLPEEAGLIDSFRVAHPDPVAEQGITWSPIYIWNGGRRRPEPLDRIDFILHKGKGLKVTDSHTVVVGEPKPQPNHGDNEWFSDHRSVLTTYEL
ncbi:Endonuclease/exonuclease/phosphatase [Fusarium acuminatum]|uniref:Endonuclease/exonuclease/phosphatase n=1 Tax=Fusarium acuminatum TaxID=5515 RepID=A0ABZ2X5A4_9HYPO